MSEARKEYQRSYYLANRTSLLERARSNYAANRSRRRETARERYVKDGVAVMLDRARQRARKRGLEFTITRDDISIPEFCPALGLRLERATGGQAKPNSPSLDRIDSSQGYVPGNVRVLSYRANAMKSDATEEELMTFAQWVLDHA